MPLIHSLLSILLLPPQLSQSDPLPEIWEWSLLASLHLALDHYVYDIEASGGEAANTSAMAFCVFYHVHPGSTTGDRW